MSTLASTAMPTESTRPARPASVKAALKEIITAITKMMLSSTARSATSPENR